MTRQWVTEAVIWGFGLWLIGYVLGILLFFVVPPSFIGWAIMPFGILLTLWVLVKKITSDSLDYYISLAIVWTLMAVVCDYLFLVKVFQPADGYYKLDVYMYYALTLTLPFVVGMRRTLINMK